MGGRRRTAGGADGGTEEHTGYKTQSKNPTQRCVAENSFTLTKKGINRDFANKDVFIGFGQALMCGT